jgi:hypothetical protein
LHASAVWLGVAGLVKCPPNDQPSKLYAMRPGQGDSVLTTLTLHEHALIIYEARLGADHPETVRSRERLAAVVAETGQVAVTIYVL